MKVREVIKPIESDGWRLRDAVGSHRQYIHQTNPGKVTVAGHPSRDVPPRHAAEYSETGRTKTTKRYAIVIERGPTSYGAYVPDLPGCVAVGDSEEEVRRLIKEAMEMHLRSMSDDGDPIPEPTSSVEYIALAS